MATINIDFSYDDNVKRSINKAQSSLSTRISDYRGIKNSLSRMSSSTGNLTTANTYIQKKMNALQSKYDKLEEFQSAVKTFNSNASAAERRVANRIKTETKQFYKREGIKTGILYTIGSVIGKGVEWVKGCIEDRFTAFVEGAKTVWENIKQWYEDNKHLLDVLIDVVCVVAAAVALVAAFATGGVLATVFAVVFAAWGLAKAGADLVYDSIALVYYNKGDMEKYEEMSNKGLKDFMADNLGATGEYLYYGMEIAAAIYGIYKIGSAVTSWYKSDGPFKKIVEQSTGIKWATKTEWKGLAVIKKIDVFTTDGAFTVKTFRTLMTEDNIGIAVIKSIKITKIGWDIASNMKSIINKCTSESTKGTLVVSTVSAASNLKLNPAANIKCNFSTISMIGLAA